ncbi:MAG: coenzyme F420-0:L-glutamate ligase [Limnochordia bacterium]
MTRLPDYVGISALGIKIGVVVPGSDIVHMVYDVLVKCDADGLLHNDDTVCITESIVARAQNNLVTTDDIALDTRRKLNLKPDSKLGILFPLLSRNRFSLILKGLARAVNSGEVVVQFAHPTDEVGNPLLPKQAAEDLGKSEKDVISLAELGNHRTRHPITDVDYIELYQQIIDDQGARPCLYICNDPLELTRHQPDGIVVANVHKRNQIRQQMQAANQNCITLQDLCSTGETAWSEWGLLGSNLSSEDVLKLAPREADKIANELQGLVAEKLGKHVEVVVYGDGAYRDPSTGIYELADPQPAFGITAGLRDRYRCGLKYKYIVDDLWHKGSSIADIEEALEARKKEALTPGSAETEGTTPRRMEDLLATLADLVSGSADAGTPVVLIKGFLN